VSEWWNEDHDFDEVVENFDYDEEVPNPEHASDDLSEGLLVEWVGGKVFVGGWFAPKTAHRIEALVLTVSSLRDIANCTLNTFKAQWRLHKNGQHQEEELYESSKRALGRLTLVSSATTNDERILGYGSIKEEEDDYILAVASQIQVATAVLMFVRDKCGTEAVNEALFRTGASLVTLAEEL